MAHSLSTRFPAALKIVVFLDQSLDLAWTMLLVAFKALLIIGIQRLPHKPISQLSIHQILQFYLVYDAIYVAAVIWVVWQVLKERPWAAWRLVVLCAYQIGHAWVVSWPEYRPYTSLPYRKVEFIAYTIWKAGIILSVVWLSMRPRQSETARGASA